MITHLIKAKEFVKDDQILSVCGDREEGYIAACGDIHRVNCPKCLEIYRSRIMLPLEGEFPCKMNPTPDFDTEHTIHDSVCAGNDTDVIRISDTEVRVLFANGGWLRLTSESPISAFIKPQE